MLLNVFLQTIRTFNPNCTYTTILLLSDEIVINQKVGIYYTSIDLYFLAFFSVFRLIL